MNVLQMSEDKAPKHCPNCSASVDETTVYCCKCGFIVDNTSLDTYERTTNMYAIIGTIVGIIVVLFFIIFALFPPV